MRNVTIVSPLQVHTEIISSFTQGTTPITAASAEKDSHSPAITKNTCVDTKAEATRANTVRNCSPKVGL